MLIEYKNVNICHTDGSNVLSGIDFHVDKGEFIYLIGRVGSGKSTLLKTLYKEFDIDEADEATVLGFNLLEMRRKEIPMLRRQLGIIFQDFQLLGDRTVYKNLEFVLRATEWKDKHEISQRINDVLKAVSMEDKADKLPHELSGGEQQRIAIARAILNDPKIILADEPTGNLDPETADNIVKLLREISQTGTAVIMTTHNMPLLDKYPGIVYRCLDTRMEEITDNFNKMQVASDEAPSPQPNLNYAAREEL
ncbi:MAG: ATP-binding cassette domain-containing protein [Prevotella sp.]|nr:ATP-binding cassette domain-containing protein [Prevotella sp.]